eukprot:TRINITY_DN243_c0_g1_i2.p1 TRINITY_DN243_c0_g1~~TRINITY_DN243_c0_g1_i2.p1  ORF type:complete len:396 (-),score=123.56 TRINITY_DN243_c0_g1_i2:331-1518(-)
MADSTEKTALVEDDHEDLSSGEEEDGDAPANTDKANVAASLLKDPAVLAALQGKLGSMVGQSSGYIQSLPPQVKRRIKSLKKIQLESTRIEADFYKEVQDLECRYQKLYQPLYEKRTQIVKGDHEPTDVECEFPSDSEDDEAELSQEVKDKKATIEDEKKEEVKDAKPEDVKGIPSFWLTIFKNVEMLAEMVQEADEPVLEKLDDVTVTIHSKPQMGFTINFHFQENDYFTNSVLQKEYEMKCEPMEDDPFSFEGPEIIKCKGCTIDWKKGKNLTVKTVKKKQKHKNKGNVRTITKQVKADSFFNFFDPPQVPDDPKAEVDEETQALLTADFEIGHYINERIVPRAVLYFTGEALEEDSDYDEEDSEEDSDEEGSDADPDFDPKDTRETPECHQQ